MIYKLSGRVERKAQVERNERSAIVPQKSAYCAEWSSTPGVSLMMRKLRKGMPYKWHTCAMAADSISTARPAGKRCLMAPSSARSVMKRSPVQINPLQMRLPARHYSGTSVFQQGSAPFVRGRKPLHLSIFIPLATPHHHGRPNVRSPTTSITLRQASIRPPHRC